MDYSEISDYDDADEYTSFNEGTGASRGSLSGSAPRKKGKKNLASKAMYGTKKARVPNIVASAGSLAGISIIATLACAIILYSTFFMNAIPQFYGALGASALVVFTLAYIASRLW